MTRAVVYFTIGALVAAVVATRHAKEAARIARINPDAGEMHADDVWFVVLIAFVAWPFVLAVGLYEWASGWWRRRSH